MPRNHETISGEEVQPYRVLNRTYRCIVHHLDQHPENMNLPIEITVNDAANRKVIRPGLETQLSDAELEVLRNAAVDTEFYIPGHSGIYSSKDPLASAKAHYPDYEVSWDKSRGLIRVSKKAPRFIVQVISD